MIAWRRLLQDDSGLALTEFAFVAPILLTAGLGGLELANYAMVKMRLNQVAVQAADNASRVGDRDLLAAQRVYEDDINDLLTGADIQAGENVNLSGNGRVIVSSLQRNADGGQTIAWQRCMGDKKIGSAYGTQGKGATGTSFKGMGPSGAELTAEPGEAVMYVEVYYTYQPLVGNSFTAFMNDAFEIRAEAAFNARGSRDLSGIYQRTPPVTVASCDASPAAPPPPPAPPPAPSGGPYNDNAAAGVCHTTAKDGYHCH